MQIKDSKLSLLVKVMRGDQVSSDQQAEVDAYLKRMIELM